MLRASRFAVGLLVCVSLARADVGSTLDEWAERFAPEPGKPLALPSYADELDRATADIGAGRYRAGLCDLTGADKKDANRARLLRAQALAGLGETADALQLLQHWPTPGDVPSTLYLGQLQLQLDDPSAALDAADKLIAQDATAYAPHLLRGQALEAAGRFKEAIDAYHWFLDPQQDLLHKWQSDPDSFDDAAALTDFATALNRWATLTMAYKDAQQLNDTVLAMYTRAFDVIDRGYDRARIPAADFCLERGDTEKAAGLVKPVAARTPYSPELLRLNAKLVSGERAQAMEGVMGTLRYADPDSPDAGLLEIRALAQTRSPAALPRAASLHQAWPKRLDIAGAYAALLQSADKLDESKAAFANADQVNDKRSDAYVTAAQLLESAYQREPAVALLKTAIARTPWDPAPRHLLGDLYLNDGYNDQAKAVLDQAYAIDPYNVKTLNYLRLLDDLSKFDVRTTEHFVIYSDKDQDPISAQEIGDYFEETYADVCGVFEYKPQTKIVVQIYPEDDAFSVRMAGVPGVENYGVSFGRVLAAIAPRKGTKQGNFNWARVLHHEFVHTINLLATDQRCPRWLTEGLAVWQEHVPFRFVNVPAELYRRTMDDSLFTIRSFPLAYIRPTRPDDGEQAYTQGAYLAMWMEETFGRESIVKLLSGYGAGKNDEDAFHAATGKTLAEIDSDWHAWMKKKVGPWNYDDASTEKEKILQDEGEKFVKAKNWDEAIKTWQAACDLQPTEVKPHQRLAGLYLLKSVNQPAKAIDHLKFLHFLELSDNRYAKQISRLYTQLNDENNAAHWAREATFVDLYDATAHDMLAAAYTKLEKTEEADRETQAAAQVRLWDEKRAAELNK